MDAGSVPRVLANLALLLGRLDAAERHFHAAFRAIERSDARLEWAHLCRERAELRIAQGAHPEAEPVLDDLRRALAREVGSRRVVNQIRATHPALVVEPTRGAEAARAGWFVQRGTTWSVGIGARPHELPDGRGLHFIAALLSRPGEEGPPTPGNAGTIGRR